MAPVMDTPTAPDPETDAWEREGDMRGNGLIDEETSTYRLNFTPDLWENGFYYFAVSADGDQVQYANSPYVLSDVFAYTGENAPSLPEPENLQWKIYETDDGRVYFAAWSNLDDYADTDSFNVTVYDKDGNYVMNNIWPMETVLEYGCSGIRVRPEFLTEIGGKYRFTVEVYSSRPNEYSSVLMPDPIPEERFSPWYHR